MITPFEFTTAMLRNLVDKALLEQLQPHAVAGHVPAAGGLPGSYAVLPASLKEQNSGYCWKSCGKGDWPHFHWKAILPPARIAE